MEENKSSGKTSPAPLGSAIDGKPTGRAASADDSPKPRTANATTRAELASLLALTPSSYRSPGIVALAAEVGKLDSGVLEGLIAELDELNPSDFRKTNLRDTLLSEMARRDPDAAIAIADEIRDTRLHADMMARVLASIAADDPQKVLSHLRSIKDPAQLSRLMMMISSTDAPGLQEGLLNLLDQRGDLDLGWGSEQLFLALGRRDFQAATSRLTEVKNNEDRKRAIEGIAGSLNPENLEDGIAFLHSLEGSANHSDFLFEVVSNVARFDPHRAVELLNEHGTAAQRPEMIGDIATAWLASNPAAARAWIESLDNPRDRVNALVNSTPPESEHAWFAKEIGELPQTDQTANLTYKIAKNWASHDPAAASAWLTSLPAGATRDTAIITLVDSWSRTDPPAVAKFLDDYTGDIRYRHDPFDGLPVGIGRIAANWVQSDPQAAAAWVESLASKGDAYTYTVEAMVRQWGQSDPQAAADYAIGIEDTKARSAGVQKLLSVWAENDLESAEQWFTQISDEELRVEGLKALVSGCHR